MEFKNRTKIKKMSYGFPPSASLNSKKVKCLTQRLSDIRYETPTSKSFFYRLDLAICFVFFNPANSTRLLMNYLYTIEKLRSARIPYYTLELCYGDKSPEIKKAFHIKTRKENVMFHKEQLCFLLEKQVPSQFTKLLFLDSDIIFENPSFYDEISLLLNSHDIVQPFRTAKWVDSEFRGIIQERLSCTLMNRKISYDSLNFHPGFGWAFKRAWFRKVGFFKHGITGSGDTLSAAAWLQMPAPHVCLIKSLKDVYTEYCNLVKKYVPKVVCASHCVFHLWHGVHKKRQYVSRHLILKEIDDVRDILEISESGLFDFNYGRDHESSRIVTRIENDLKQYFIERDDDEVQ